MKREHAYKLREMMHKAAISLGDGDALEAVELFPAWESEINYAVDYRVRYGDKLYRVVQGHVSQEGWEPPNVPALFTEVAKPGEIPQWKQPTGAQDAYQIGDKVRHNGSIWISTAANNVWEPGVYGWEMVE